MLALGHIVTYKKLISDLFFFKINNNQVIMYVYMQICADCGIVLVEENLISTTNFIYRELFLEKLLKDVSFDCLNINT